jgi:crotonobetainyl-CoA:carnitine CoA-transferase CaiB-like acyl-CoA transferase
MNEHGVPNGKINRAPDMLEDIHFKAREAIVTLKHPAFDEIKMHNVFPKLSDMPGKVKWCGPELGQHNNEIYEVLLNLDKERIVELTEKGII